MGLRVRISILFLTFFALAVPVVAAEGPRISVREVDGKTFLFGDDGFSGETKIGEVHTMPAGTKLYEWVGEDRARPDRLQISASRFAELRRDFDPKDHWAGGGMYFSRDPLNSSDYGTKLLVMETKNPVRYVEADPLKVSMILNSIDAARLFPEIPEVTGEHAFTLLLEAEGVVGWEYKNRGTSKAWVNFIDYAAIGSFRIPTDAEVLHDFVAANPDPSPEESAKLKRLFPKACPQVLTGK